MINFKHHLLSATIFIALIFSSLSIYAQQGLAGIDIEEPKVVKTDGVEFSVLPDKTDWVYKVGEKPTFTIKLFVDGQPVTEADMSYMIGPEKMEPTRKGKITLVNGYAKLEGEAMNEPGFLRCDVRVRAKGKIHKSLATVAFDPQALKPTGVTPSDFKKFWSDAIKTSKRIPLNSKLTPIPAKSNDAVDVYEAEYEFFNNGNQKFYGVLSVPKKAGKYPAIIRFPGAGVLPLGGDANTAADGFITLDLYIHGRSVLHERSYYTELQKNELKGYQYFGVEDRDSFYYKNVILGCVRSVDLIYSLPQFDGKNIGGWGSSQGGALSIITTSLESRINFMVALCPAMCDFTGYLHNRAGGWPHVFADPKLYQGKKDQVIKSLSYYDVVNFAKDIKVPAFLSFGFNDGATPPTTCFVAYNQITSPKQLYIIPEGVHKIYPEQKKRTYAWLTQSLKK